MQKHQYNTKGETHTWSHFVICYSTTPHVRSLERPPAIYDHTSCNGRGHHRQRDPSNYSTSNAISSSYLSESLTFARGKLSGASRTFLQAEVPNPPRSCDRLDDDHMTAEVHRRWGELVPLVAVHGRLSYFDFDGFSHLSL